MTAPLVLLHPLGSDGSFFGPLRSRMPGVPTLCPDLLGHGKADRGPHTPSPADYADDVLRQIDRAGHDTVDVLGVSLGALVAVALAAANPQRIRRLVLADCTPLYPPAMVTMWNERAAAVETGGVGAVVQPTMDLWFTQTFLEEHPELAYIRQVLESTDPQGYAGACRALAAADVRDAATSMTTPTLVVCGTEDAPPFRDGAEWLRRSVPDARTAWITGGRHACVFENADEVAEVLTGFLESN